MDYLITHGKRRMGIVLYCADCKGSTSQEQPLDPFLIRTVDLAAIMHFVRENPVADFTKVTV